MRSRLAEKLLAKTMNWSAEETSIQRPLLQALASFKYNEYQQFSPGMRFIESLVKWLTQFKTVEEKKTAYKFILDSLIFISSDQVTHLVNITFADKVRPIVIKKTANSMGVSPYQVRKIVKSKQYKNNLRRSLFIGLSDGSKIDFFRRSAPSIDNEQVLTAYSIGGDKIEDMLKELKNAGINSKFNTIFLIDDFTASGTSYFRKTGDKWKGKIFKFLESISPKGKNANLVEENESLDVHIIFYIATKEALLKLKENIQTYKSDHPRINFSFSITAVQIIGSEVKEEILRKTAFIALIKKYFDKSIIDRHYQEGNKHDEPYLGFNECCLPVILSHNTPNNSLPILWFPDDKVIGLFPRIKRHKDE